MLNLGFGAEIFLIAGATDMRKFTTRWQPRFVKLWVLIRYPVNCMSFAIVGAIDSRFFSGNAGFLVDLPAFGDRNLFVAENRRRRGSIEPRRTGDVGWRNRFGANQTTSVV